MAGLSDVSHFTLHSSVISATVAVLAEAGHAGHEAFVLWGAVRSGPTSMHICTALRPAQHPRVTDEGLLVTVPGESLFAVNKCLYERGETLTGQVHSHPGQAFHSDTDDAYPLVTLRGALSAVVPDFARGGTAALFDWAWYRLGEVGEWVHVDPRTLIEVVE